MNNVRTHIAYDSALQNILEAAGFAHDHANRKNLPTASPEEMTKAENDAESQARDLIDCGECGCCA